MISIQSTGSFCCYLIWLYIMICVIYIQGNSATLTGIKVLKKCTECRKNVFLGQMHLSTNFQLCALSTKTMSSYLRPPWHLFHLAHQWPAWHCMRRCFLWVTGHRNMWRGNFHTHEHMIAEMGTRSWVKETNCGENTSLKRIYDGSNC